MSKETRRHIGQLIVGGFSGLEIPDELRALAREFDLGGIILFDRNVETPEQIAELSCSAQELSRERPLWVSVDQEGGRVSRFREPFTVWPSAQNIGLSADRGLAARFAGALADELRAVGVTLDFAPVLDVNTNLKNEVIGDRALSSEAEEVARLGATIIEGLQAKGVAACGKHFPGHGDTDRDSHYELPVVEHGLERLREIEIRPFREAIESKVAVIMTAHVLYSGVDDNEPATLSHEIVTGILREELRFDGIIATDDMGMAGISDRYSLEDATVRAVAAGCDMVLLCGADIGEKASVLEELIRAVEDGRLSEKRIENAFTRQAREKIRFLGDIKNWRPPSNQALQKILGCNKHVAVAEEIGQHS